MNNPKLESSKKELIDELVQSLIGDSNYINDTFTKFVESLALPVDFFVDFQYDSPNKEIKIDLDLPEIEDLPNQFAEVTQSGRLSIKNKSQKQLKEEYVKCSLGLGIFLACNVFNTSPVIQKVQVSGYTQRLSKKTGHITDEYVYSVRFDRATLQKLNTNNIEPIEAVKNFENKSSITKTFQMNPIEPFS